MDLLMFSQKKDEIARLAEIGRVMGRYGLADWLRKIPIEQVRNFVASPETQLIGSEPWQVRFRLALTELGTTFIKFGQMLSTRDDLVGKELAEELAKLQSRTPADPPEVVRQTITEELGKPPEQLFAEFDGVALASASVGQVHRARLADGQPVVVKVQHAGIRPKILSDLDVLTTLARLLEQHVPAAAPYTPLATISSFRRTLLRELDFTSERHNLDQFRRNFSDDETVHFPQPYAELSASRVLTMEFLEGPSGTNQEAIHRSGADLKEFSLRAAQMYLNMIFRDGFYHADPHPGNYVLLPGGVVGVLDGGMVGRIDDDLRELFEDGLLALSRHDAASLCDLLLRAGSAPAGIDVAVFRGEVSEFLADYTGQSLDEFDLSGAIRRLTEIIRIHQLVLPAGVSLVLKTLVMLESTAKQLDPAFNLVELIEPMQSKLLRQRFSPGRMLKKLQRSYHDLDRLISTAPRNVADLLDQFRSGKVTIKHEHEHLQTAVNRMVLGLLTSALFLGSSQLCRQPLPPVAYGVSIPGAAGCLVAVLLGIQLVQSIRKDAS